MPLYELDGKAPRIEDAERCWIAPGAAVIGDIDLAADVSIWFGAVLRGDNERIAIGAGSNVQEMVTMHTDPGFPLSVGVECTIGHGAILHGCTIGDGALVGMGATVLNGARIGAGSLVGAGALVTEGKEFPENSLIVGVPAKAVRTLDAAAVAGLRESAHRYIENGRRFARGLKEVSEDLAPSGKKRSRPRGRAGS